ncbi:MAG: L-lactate permease, partial [Chloroflexota bacterium]
AVTFGSLASSFLALIAATGRSGTELAPWSAFMLAIAGYGCGAIVLWVAGGWQALRRRVGYLMLFGTAMGLVQYTLAQFGFYTIASFLAGLVGLGLMLFTFQRAGGESKIPAWSLLPYVLLVAIVLLGQSILKTVLDFMVLNLSFDRVETAKGWLVPAGSGRSINLFGHGGALLLYTILITTAIYLIQKRLDSGSIVRILKGTWKRGIRTTIGIFTMVAMAVVMDNAGMTQLIAEGMSQGVGRAFPAIAPWIGALGAFMTGSNTNSNVVFASMQQQTAVLLGMSPAIILAAQTTGGAIGALFAPAKVIVGCSTVDLEGEEAGVFRLALLYGGVILLSITVLTVLAVWLS